MCNSFGALKDTAFLTLNRTLAILNRHTQKSLIAASSNTVTHQVTPLFEIPGEGYFGRTHRDTHTQVSMVTHPCSRAQQRAMGCSDDCDNLTMTQLVEFSTAWYGKLGQ